MLSFYIIIEKIRICIQMVIDVSTSPKQSDGNTAAPAFLIGYTLGKEILTGRV